jgi:hypothetical protein
MNKVMTASFVAATCGAAFLFGYVLNFKAIDFAEHLPEVAKQLAETLFIVTAFVERSTAVLGSIWFDEAIAASRIREILVREHAKPDQDFREAFAALEEASGNVARLEAQKDRMRSFCALAIGLMVSATGVRTLEHLQNVSTMNTADYATQLACFRTVDILITAGLIAGGTAGIKLIVELLATIVQRTRQKLMRRSPGGVGIDAALR